MAIFPSQWGSFDTWGQELRDFFSPYFDLATSKPIAAYVDAASYALLSDALTAAAGKTLLIGKNFTLIANTTIPSTVSIEMLKGGSFTKASTFTLTINGPFEAGLYQVFSGFSAGDVTFGAGAVKEVYPEWWGAVGDAVTNDAVSIQNAINALTTGNIRLSKTYGVGVTSWVGLQLKSSVNIIGNGTSGLKVLAVPSQYPYAQSGQPTVLMGESISDVTISSVEINGNGLAVCLLSINTGTNIKIADNYFHDNNITTHFAILFDASENITITGNRLYNIGGGIYTGNVGYVDYVGINFKITNNKISTTIGSDSIVGGLRDSVISGNVIDGSAASGIAIASNNIELSYNVSIIGNVIKNVTWHGIQSDVLNVGTLKRIIITGNLIENCAKSGIYLVHCDGITVFGNIINNFSTESNGAGYGIYMAHTQYGTISENILKNTVQYGTGIFVQSYDALGTDYSHSISIVGNNVYNVYNGIANDITGTVETIDGIRVIGNKVDTIGHDAISFTTAGGVMSNIICSDNIVTGTIVRHEYYYDSSLLNTAFGSNNIGVIGVGNLASKIGVKKIIMATAAPTTLTWAVGDKAMNSNPAVGQPKGWICTVAGSPGTWASEGNL